MENIFSHIFLLAGIQGILLSILLFSRKVNHSANILLGFSVLALSFDLFDAVYYLDSFFYKYPHLFGLTFAATFLYGPVFYLYLKLLTTGRKFNKKDLLHFLPFFLVIFYIIPVLLLNSEQKVQFILQTLNNPPLDIRIINYFKSIQGTVYSILVFVTIHNHNKKLKDSFSNMDRINLKWFRNLLAAMIFVWLLFVVGSIVNIFVNVEYESVIHLVFSIFIYSIGYTALKQPEIFIQPVDDEKEKKFPKAEVELNERYKKSGLTDEAAEELHNSLLELMNNQKPYLERELTLSKLAELLDVTQHNLSEVINTKLEQNFYDFVNKFRVEEFKRKLEEPESEKYSLLALAYDSGFNSKTSFNIIFKKQTGMTPSQFRERVKNNKPAAITK